MPSHPSLERLKKVINALSSAQKRDFKRYIQSLGGDSTRYVKLFDAINGGLKLKRFPEKFVEELEQKKVLRKAEEFSAVAGILYEKILESTRSTPETRVGKTQLMGYLVDIQFLTDKELYGEALALLEKARSTAARLDYATILLDLLVQEREILLVSKRSDFLNRLDGIKAEENDLLQRMMTDQGIYSLNVELVKRLTQNISIHPEVRTILDEWRRETKRSDGKVTNKPFRTNRRLLIALLNDMDYFESLGPEAASERQESARRIVQLYDDYPQFKTEEPELYLQHLGLHLSIALENGAFDDFNRYRGQLRQTGNSAAFCRWVAPVFLHWYKQSAAFEEGCRFILEQNLPEQLEQYYDKIVPSRYMAICFSCAELAWLGGRLDVSSDFFERIIQYQPNSFRVDIQCCARFMLIPLNHDRGIFNQHKTPESFIDSLNRWMKKHSFKKPFYQNLLTIAEAIAVEPDTFLRRTGVHQAIANLEEHLAVPRPELEPFTTFYGWLQARQGKGSFPEVIARLNNEKAGPSLD